MGLILSFGVFRSILFRTISSTQHHGMRKHSGSPKVQLGLKHGQAQPTSLKTVPARPKTRPGRREKLAMVTANVYFTLNKGSQHRLLHNHVSVRYHPEHTSNKPARPTMVNEVQNSFANLSLIQNR